jgi:hypothetical protein
LTSARQIETVQAGSPARLSFLSQPLASIVAGNSLFGTTLEVTDRYGNPVAGVSVSLSLSSGTLRGLTTVTTNASGHAVFSNLSYKVVGAVTLEATGKDLPVASTPLIFEAVK